MDISFASRGLEKSCCDLARATRKFGPQLAEVLRQRLDMLKFSTTLAEMRNFPQARCHELRADLKGCLSLDLVEPYRLIISPQHNPLPKKPDGGLDWHGVKAVLVHGITNTHE